MKKNNTGRYFRKFESKRGNNVSNKVEKRFV